MGLIKTAMMTGGGIYAVKQLTKTAERRHENNSNYNNQQQQSSRDLGYQGQQGYWSPGSGPQGQQGQQGPPRPYYQDQREWSSYNQNQNQNQNNEPQYATRGCDYGPSDPYDHKRSYREDDYQYRQRDHMAGQPSSSYPDQQQQQEGYSSRTQEDSNRGSGGGGLSDTTAGLAGMAMKFVRSGKGKSGGKGAKLGSEFFGK